VRGKRKSCERPARPQPEPSNAGNNDEFDLVKNVFQVRGIAGTVVRREPAVAALPLIREHPPDRHLPAQAAARRANEEVRPERFCRQKYKGVLRNHGWFHTWLTPRKPWITSRQTLINVWGGWRIAWSDL
jgi:hypothetical protein